MSTHSLTDLEVDFAIIHGILLIIINYFRQNQLTKLPFDNVHIRQNAVSTLRTFRRNGALEKVSFDEMLYSPKTSKTIDLCKSNQLQST